MLRQYFSCNEKLVVFLTCFCNILCNVRDDESGNLCIDSVTRNALGSRPSLILISERLLSDAVKDFEG